MDNREITKDILVAAIQQGIFDNVATVFSNDGTPDLVTPRIQAIADAFKTIHSVVNDDKSNSTQEFKATL